MLNKNLKCTLYVYTIMSLGHLFAQETIPASGGNNIGTSGNISYTVGQPFTNQLIGANASVISGVQQPYEISVIIGMNDMYGISLSCKIYPNPVTDLLQLEIANDFSKGLTYQLTDANGKVLENKLIAASEMIITMAHLSPAVYFLKITEDNNIIKSFKIIKK